MSIKHLRKSAILFIGAIVIALGLLPARLSAQELTLTAGTTTLVAKGDAVCVNDLRVGSDTHATTKSQGCSGNRATVNLNAGITLLPMMVDLTASTRFVKQFHVAAVQGAPKNSFLPILIAVPVKWRGGIFNDNALPNPLALPGLVGFANVNMFLRLTEGTPGNPAARGTGVSETRFMGASHGGIVGCLDIPATEVTAAKMLATCALAVFQRDDGSGTIYLSAVVESGKTYNIELELLVDVYSPDTAPPLSGPPDLAHPHANFEHDLDPLDSDPDPFGLTWNDSMSITVGTDFQSNIQALQDEITQLRADLNTLRQEFKTHTHVYLTGKGVGQNNTRATTTPPLFVP
ncbi:MAG TPA: hypothetical protein VFN26_05115 [Candidatus Acidoferrum sp.]|nr:hypothetical protein [Candidatus Acidoferrum sp.]